MKHRLHTSISISYLTLTLSISLFMIPEYSDAASVNIKATILDSVSRTPIPQVRVTVQELVKSFTTTRSSFVITLPAGTYTLVLENPEYETIRETYAFKEKNNDLVFEMIKITDREILLKQGDAFYKLLDSLSLALERMDWPQALVYQGKIMACENPPSYNAESLAQSIQAGKTKILDSLMAIAKIALDSHKLADAYYYYSRVAEYDSTNEIARNKAAELYQPKPTPKPESQEKPISPIKKEALSPAEIEILFQKGVGKFIAAEYSEAERIFKKILVINPNHEKAKEYLRRTETRIKALKQ